MILTVGTRGSRLSLNQTNQVLEQLKAGYPDVQFKTRIIKTLGDKEQSLSLFSLDRKGVFEKEIDLSIENGEVDFAVHSLKDVPILEHSQTSVVGVTKRCSPNDVLISKDNVSFAELSKGAIVGTSSLRRMAQILHLRPDLVVKPIRGNVDTRIKKVKTGEFDALVVAEAGLIRLGLENSMSERFSLTDFAPSAGQGALGLVAKNGNTEVIQVLESINSIPSLAEVTAERSLVLALEGGCRVPIGAIGRACGEKLSLYGCVYSLSGAEKIVASADGRLVDAQVLGKQVAMCLLEQGANELEAEWRKKYGSW